MDMGDGATEQASKDTNRPTDGEPAALAAYKRFIDLCVEVARGGVIGRRLRDNWPFTEPQNHPDLKRFNDMLASLTAEQRAWVAELVQGERMGAIGDLLAQMTWKDLRVVDQGVELAWEPHGTENYYDFTCRYEGDQWPDERTEGTTTSPDGTKR